MTIDLTKRSPIKPFDVLTTREQQVASALSNGRTNREIATELGCSIKTVDTHRMRVMKKLKIANNVLLTRLALKTGFSTLETAPEAE